MLFRHLSGTRDLHEMKKQRINYLTFLKQFGCLLPKRPPRFPRSLDPSERNVILDQLRRKQGRLQFELAFNLVDTDCDGQINMFDLICGCSEFSQETPLGSELITVLDLYLNTNVRPKYVRQKFIIDVSTFQQLLPQFSLLADLRHAFCKRITDGVEAERLQNEEPGKQRLPSEPNEYQYSFKVSPEL